VETQGSDDEELLNDVCMHIAAFNPSYIVPEDVPEDVLAKEREIAAAQMAGKPAEMMDKIVQGKISKWYTEVCLTRQPWLRDDKSSLAKLAPKLKVKRFVRWQIGEGE
jgi:elongation factor Ts